MSHWEGKPLDDSKGPAGANCGLEGPGVMFYIRTGSLLPTLTSPSHDTCACTHTLTAVPACYSP